MNSWTPSSDENTFSVDVTLDKLIIGETNVMRQLKQTISMVAPSDTPILVQGPTGAGKELVAEALHMLSGRKGKLVAVNCGAIPQDLLESQLFGHEKGSFTGAHDRQIGLIEQANGGTLFLDEIDDLSPKAQAELLRALETRRIQRVGGAEQIEVDFRLVSASRHGLEKQVAEGKFRSDLLFRIAVFALRVPALCERPEDIPLILRAMSQNKTDVAGNPVPQLNLTVEAYKALAGYEWEGNVRELRNFHDRAQILFAGRQITDKDIRGGLLSSNLTPTELPVAEPEIPSVAAGAVNLEQMLQERGSVDLRSMLQGVEKKIIQTALEMSNGRVSAAAKMLSMKRTTLIGKMGKLGISADVADIVA